MQWNGRGPARDFSIRVYTEPTYYAENAGYIETSVQAPRVLLSLHQLPSRGFTFPPAIRRPRNTALIQGSKRNTLSRLRVLRVEDILS